MSCKAPVKRLWPAGIPDAADAVNAAATAYAAYVAAAPADADALAVAEISLRLAVGQYGEGHHLLLFSADFQSTW